MNDFGFNQVRVSLARLLEATQTAGSSEQRAKLEELTRELVTTLREMEKKLLTLPGTDSDLKVQQAELKTLQQMLKSADTLLLSMPTVFQNVEVEMREQ